LTGFGILTLSGSNTYTGGTTIRQGTINITALTGAGTGVITLGDANTGVNNVTLTGNSGTGITPMQNNIVVANQGSGTAILELTLQNAQWGGASIQLNRATTFQANYAGAGGAYLGKYDNTSVISGNVGTLTVQALSTGLAYVAGNNTFVGTVVLPQGNVRTFHVNAFGASGNSVIMSGTASLTMPGQTIGSLTGASGNSISNSGTLTISSTSSAVFAGVISGTGSLSKGGSGTQTLSGTNTFSGATTVSAGILNLRNATGLGTTAGSTTVSNGATLQLQDGITVGAEALSLNGGAASGQTGALVNVSGTNSYGGAVTVTASSSISAASGSVLNLTGGVVKDGTVATFNGGGTINVNTVAISGSSPNSDLVIDGTTVNLGVASTYNGPTFIRNSGTLNANVTNALPTANGRTAVTFDGTGTSVLSLAAAQSVASLTSAGAATVTLGANALTVGASTGSTTFAGIIGGTGGLTKDGASTQPLTGANTYTGGTTINGGTLELSGASGALTATSAVNISGGTLSLSGSAANRISNTASISLGAAGSTLQLSGAVIETLGAMTLAGGVGARVIDFGVTSGVLTLASLSAASNLPLHIWNWSGTTGTGGGTDQLVISSGFLEGSLAASNVSFFSGSGTGLYSGATTFTASGGELVPSVSVSVPEPGTFFPAAVLVVGAFLRRRRGRCRAARA
jgi:autotransporter-associated beta strand protein